MPEVLGYEMFEVGSLPREVRRVLPELEPHQVRVKVAGCGLCHTDIGYLFDGVPTRKPAPLILGHEISGVVVEAGADYAHLVDRAVVVPAVLPCGTCADCTAGAPMICRNQIMPGNDADGGFAEQVIIPGYGLCPIPGASTDPDAPLGDVPGLTLRHLAVIADAVSTAFQAVHRSGVGAGQLAIIIGLGGVGGYAAQFCRDLGATVVGIDVDPIKLANAESQGISKVFDAREIGGRELKSAIRNFAKEAGLPLSRWSILECSGSSPGQNTAFSLLVHGATLMVVGYTQAKIELRLSNLMAFDARALGNWGCDPVHYPAIVDAVLQGRIDVASHTEIRPLSELGTAMQALHSGGLPKRVVFAPDLHTH